jgi:hypothetical protein
MGRQPAPAPVLLSLKAQKLVQYQTTVWQAATTDDEQFGSFFGFEAEIWRILANFIHFACVVSESTRATGSQFAHNKR